MEDVVVTPTDTTTPATEAVAPSAEIQSTQPTEAAAGSPEASLTGSSEAPAYEPNLSFKVYDQEKKFDDWVKPLITSPEMEKKVRELYEKAHGLDFVKPKLERTREELTQVSEAKTRYDGIVQTLSTHVKNEDFDSFFKDTGIPEAMIFRWVANKLKYSELPPEEKRAYDERMELRRKNATLERDYGQATQKVSQAETQKLEFELNAELSKPEINATMREYDQRMGHVGAFREQIAIQAYANEIATGQRVTASQAVANLLTLMGKTPGSQPAVSAPPSQGGVIQPQEKPVIPNFRGRSGSPVKKVPSSMEEFKAQTKARLEQLNQ